MGRQMKQPTSCRKKSETTSISGWKLVMAWKRPQSMKPTRQLSGLSHVVDRGAPRWCKRYSSGTAGQEVSGSLQNRWCFAGDASATETFAICNHQPPQNYDRFHEHCRETPATGRSDPGKNQKEANRSSRLNDSY